MAVKAAIPYVQQGAGLHGLTSIYSTSPELPEPRLCFRDEPTGEVVFHAPLVFECLEGAALDEFLQLITYRSSKHTHDLWTGANRRSLMRRLNGYLLIEANLWDMARDAGYPHPPPYAVRYEAARWLWSPEIAGVAFCLRCGSELIYRRAARDGSTRHLRCNDCSRGSVDDWPVHAICPAGRGTWWLHCQTDGCSKNFIGHAQARRCPLCTTSKLTVGKRKPLTRNREA